MPRIRTIKPELPDDEVLGQVEPLARYLFVLLITQADDHGCVRADPRFIASRLFPYDDDITGTVISRLLENLAQVGRIGLYVVDGQQYLELTNWAKHQRVDNAGKRLHPPPPRLAATRGESPLDHDHDQDHDPDQGPADPTAASYPQIDMDVAAALSEYARRVAARTSGVKNAGAYRKRVEANARRDLSGRAGDLLAKYVLSPTQVAEVLLSEAANEPSVLLRTAARRAAS